MSTYEPIASQTLGSAAASVTFSSIPQGYTDLVIVINGALSGSGVKLINFNGVSTLYSCTTLIGYGTGTSSGRYTDPYIDVWNAAANPFVNIIQINNYSNSTTFKTYLARQGAAATSTEAIVGLWRSTAAITTVSFSASGGQTYASGSTFSLYGIQVGDKAQKAQGGNIVTSDGTYVYHAFTSSGTFIPNQALTADVLVIAGGGGGGKDKGGGGGAGGVSYQTGRSLTAISYPVIVGAGGVRGTGYTGSGLATAGNNSIFATITSIGGGLGGTDNSATEQVGGNGGSGGGGSRNTGGSGTQGNSGGATGYGNGGGAGFNNNPYKGGGGGGAGGGGSSAGSSNTNAAGGDGLNTWSSWASATNTGVSGYYAGGGGAGGYFPSASPAGGAGGAGGGGTGGGGGANGAGVGVAGTTNTGGGGGGGGNTDNGGNGGSGIVIIRYLA